MEMSQLAQEAKLVKSNLAKYCFIKKFLGNIINQRLRIECFTHGMLTANLLDDSEIDLRRLDNILKLGEKYCTDFRLIFRGKRLPQASEIADAQIIDTLAEIKAFEFLRGQGFSNIASIKRLAGARTVDFTAQANGEDYAIEVTRLGLAQSEKKQPVYELNVDALRQNKCEDANGFAVSMIIQGTNVPRLKQEISGAIDNKYPQMKEFFQSGAVVQKGILFISSGRDYFVMRNYENKEYEITPYKDFTTALTEIWESPAQKDLKNYISHIVITRGKDLKKAIVYPSL